MGAAERDCTKDSMRTKIEDDLGITFLKRKAGTQKEVKGTSLAGCLKQLLFKEQGPNMLPSVLSPDPIEGNRKSREGTAFH